jgi:hypothetical protein
VKRIGFAIVLALAVAHACAKGAAVDSPPDGGPDASVTPDSGPLPCKTDDACGAQRWCEKATGICRDAKACPQGQGNCDYQWDPSAPDYCGGHACYCDPADRGCKPLHPPCSSCARTSECGNDKLAYDYPADCVPPDAGFATTSVCIPRRDGYFGCPPGYQTPAAGAYCLPGGGRCGGQGACAKDADCDPHSAAPICNAQLGLCVAACTFDLKTGDSPACPSGQVCHLTPLLAQLPPQDPNFGKGKCGPPCSAATACGTGLVCRSEGIDHPVQRCGLAPPACMGDIECPDSPSTGSRGYCDLAAHACKTDCRASADCHAGYLCANHACVAETCLQAGGAATGCNYGQFCCGENEGPSPCPAGVDAGQCYDAPAQTWCGSCSNSSDCKSFPARPGEPNLCADLGNNKKACALGCDPGHPAECPRSWGCVTVYVGCDKDGDCGSQSGAHCDKPADGGSGSCTCSSDANCPNDSNNTTYCRQQKCVFGSVCRPSCP